MSATGICCSPSSNVAALGGVLTDTACAWVHCACSRARTQVLNGTLACTAGYLIAWFISSAVGEGDLCMHQYDVMHGVDVRGGEWLRSPAVSLREPT